MNRKNTYVERRPQGDSAVRKAGSDSRASATTAGNRLLRISPAMLSAAVQRVAKCEPYALTALASSALAV